MFNSATTLGMPGLGPGCTPERELTEVDARQATPLSPEEVSSRALLSAVDGIRPARPAQAQGGPDPHPTELAGICPTPDSDPGVVDLAELAHAGPIACLRSPDDEPRALVVLSRCHCYSGYTSANILYMSISKWETQTCPRGSILGFPNESPGPPPGKPLGGTPVPPGGPDSPG